MVSLVSKEEKDVNIVKNTYPSNIPSFYFFQNKKTYTIRINEYKDAKGKTQLTICESGKGTSQKCPQYPVKIEYPKKIGITWIETTLSNLEKPTEK